MSIVRDFLMGISVRIRALRKARGMKQEDFAEALGMSVQTVSRWENGTDGPDIVMLPLLCACFPMCRPTIVPSNISAERCFARVADHHGVRDACDKPQKLFDQQQNDHGL